jgi:hypothetical protein
MVGSLLIACRTWMRELVTVNLQYPCISSAHKLYSGSLPPTQSVNADEQYCMAELPRLLELAFVRVRISVALITVAGRANAVSLITHNTRVVPSQGSKFCNIALQTNFTVLSFSRMFIVI